MVWKTQFLFDEGTVHLTIRGALELKEFRRACSEALGAARHNEARKVLVDSRQMRASTAGLELLSLPGLLNCLDPDPPYKVAVIQPPCPEVPGLFGYFEGRFSSDSSAVRFFPDLAKASVWLEAPSGKGARNQSMPTSHCCVGENI